MNKSELAERLAARAGMTKDAARDAVDGMCATICETLANGEEVRIAGFGACLRSGSLSVVTVALRLKTMTAAKRIAADIHNALGYRLTV